MQEGFSHGQERFSHGHEGFNHGHEGFRHGQEQPLILSERYMDQNPSHSSNAERMRGTTESTSTEQFTTITTLFYG